MPKKAVNSDTLNVLDNLSVQWGTNVQSLPPPTTKQHRKRNAFELAELIYDIYKDSLSNDKIIGDNGEDL